MPRRTSKVSRSPQGYKLYQLRSAHNTGFGDLYNPGAGGGGSPHYTQFGLKLYF
ncbi:MAG: hypothetical protein M3N54_03405 [Acidobacteriota bacterium]|nr:hypothetical protein [Acidobacteriota bacterium]